MNRKFHGPASLGTFNKWHPLLYKDTDSGSGKAVLRNIYMYMITWLSKHIQCLCTMNMYESSEQKDSASVRPPFTFRPKTDYKKHRNIILPTPVITQIYITPKQHLNTSCLAQPTPLLTKNIRKHIHRWKENAPKSSNFYFCPPPKKKTKAPCVHKQTFEQKEGGTMGHLSTHNLQLQDCQLSLPDPSHFSCHLWTMASDKIICWQKGLDKNRYLNRYLEMFSSQ